MLVNRNGRIVGKGLDSLGELFFGPSPDPSNNKWSGKKLVEKDGALGTLEAEVAAARKRLEEAQRLAQEMARLQAELADAQKRAAEESKRQEARITSLRLTLHQAHLLRPFGVGAAAIQAASEELPVLEEELEQRRAVWAAKQEEIRQRVKEIEGLPHAQAYLAERRKEAKMGSPPIDPNTPAEKSESAAQPHQRTAVDSLVALEPQSMYRIAPNPAEVKEGQNQPTEADLRRAFTAWLHREVKPNLQPRDIVLTLALGKAVHLRPGPGGDGAEEFEACLVSSVGTELPTGQAFRIRRLPGGPKSSYRLDFPDGGKRLIGRLWLWEGDPEKAPGSPVQVGQPQPKDAQIHEKRACFAGPPVVVCTLAPANGDLKRRPGSAATGPSPSLKSSSKVAWRYPRITHFCPQTARTISGALMGMAP